jgi:hypothetical protein
MRPASTLSRALCLLLAVTALLPAALLARAPACGTAGAAMARACCCEPAAPACGSGAVEASTSTLTPTECSCCAAPQPAAPAERTLTPPPELASLAALPPTAERAACTSIAAAARGLVPAGHRAAGCELLRLHCVNLI